MWIILLALGKRYEYPNGLADQRPPDQAVSEESVLVEATDVVL
jgi:hypothetical protein